MCRSGANRMITVSGAARRAASLCNTKIIMTSRRSNSSSLYQSLKICVHLWFDFFFSLAHLGNITQRQRR
jgi:hypothetical protein